MPQRLSKAFLYNLRNQIPIPTLIASRLRLQVRYQQRQLRFQCPLCRNFNTATNPKTNLARCFSCNKNFNTIDMVMAVRNCSFIMAVEFLKPFLHQ